MVRSLTPVFETAAMVGVFAATGSLDPVGWATVAVAVLLLQLHGGHGRRLDPAVSDELPMMVAAVCAAGIAGSAFSGFGPETGRIAQAAAVGAAAVVLARASGYAIVRGLRGRGFALEKTVIVGSGPVGAEIAETLERCPHFGLRPVGFVDDRNGRDLPLPFLGTIADLPVVVPAHKATRMIVAFGPSREEDLVETLRAWDGMAIEVYVVPRLFELGVGVDGNADDVNGIPLVKLHRLALRGPTWRLKRAVDVVAAALGLVLTSPLMIAVAIAVRIDSPGPILFRQKRIGRSGALIEILKFRTMLVNDDSDTTWSVNGDARKTRVGRLLRATHLDELPQLIGVLRGDMSLVGPRPERPYYVDLFAAEIPRYKDRHRVPVGLTGWAQIHGLNGDTSIHDRARYDNRYIERWSLWRDLVILTRTGKAIFTGVGQARRAEKAAAEIDLRDRVIDLTEAGGSPTNGHVSRNGHAIGTSNGNGNGSVAHLDAIQENGQAKAPAPDGT